MENLILMDLVVENELQFSFQFYERLVDVACHKIETL